MQKKTDNIMHMSLMKDTDANAAFIFSYCTALLRKQLFSPGAFLSPLAENATL
jgi:hypothetical protein